MLKMTIMRQIKSVDRLFSWYFGGGDFLEFRPGVFWPKKRYCFLDPDEEILAEMIHVKYSFICVCKWFSISAVHGILHLMVWCKIA